MANEKPRIFIALEIAASVRRALLDTAEELSRCGADARWTREANLHVTLKFLGPVAADQLAPIDEALRRALATTTVFGMTTVGLGVFPNSRRPRILWAGAKATQLSNLAATIDAALAPLGFAPEEGDFHAHVTLARLRSRHGWPALRAAVEACGERNFGGCQVASVVTFLSDLRRDGAVYTKLYEAPLACSVDEGGNDGN
jgi:2'-5' RNA ligase